MAAAKAQAEAQISAGHADHQRRLEAIKAEVDQMTRRRDAITAQLGQLRDVIAGFGGDDDRSASTVPNQQSPA